MNHSKGFGKKAVLFLGMVTAVTLLFAVAAFAGWNTTDNGKKVTYTDETGTAVTGFRMIKKDGYYFDKDGFLQTGWKSTEDGFRYFSRQGKPGSGLGAMYADGIFQLGEEWFGFDENGIVMTGFQELSKDSYFFSKSKVLGERGMAARNKFKDLPDGRRAYFDETGRMVFDKWVKKHKYYIDENGNMARSTVTPDGSVLKEDGTVKEQLTSSAFFKLSGKYYFYKKDKGLLKNKVFAYKGEHYYVDKNGVRQSGWINWKDHDYYFLPEGEAVTGQNKIGGVLYTFNSEGQLEGERSEKEKEEEEQETPGSVKVLIMCGHGQGDSGAVGLGGKYVESFYTRDFGKRIYEALQETDNVEADLFNTKYDMFQQMRATVNSSGVTGSGSKKKKVLKAIRRNSRIPDLTSYDYALEVHFNATAYSAKDPGGDGKKKGTGTYVNVHKKSSNRKIDRKIISALNGLGLNTWGSGVYGSSGLLNARIFTEIGVNYTLLETCFIDDRDDMKFYLKKRDAMASAVAGAISKYFR